MGRMVQKQVFCPTCNTLRLFEKEGTSHLVHAIVSLFLCGLWIPIWILAALANSSQPARCTQCGASIRKPFSWAWAIITIVISLGIIGAISSKLARVAATKNSPPVHQESIQPATPREPGLKTSIAPSTPTTEAATDQPAMTLAESIRSGMKRYEDDAFSHAQRSVERSLKSSGSAQFSSRGWDKDTGVIPHGFYQWRASGSVESQNSFGATLRQDWIAVVRLTNGSLHTVWIRVGTDSTGEMPGPARAPVAKR